MADIVAQKCGDLIKLTIRFDRAQQMVTQLDRRSREAAKRYNAAKMGNNHRFRYLYRLRLASLEAVSNSFRRYAKSMESKITELVTEIRYRQYLLQVLAIEDPDEFDSHFDLEGEDDDIHAPADYVEGEGEEEEEESDSEEEDEADDEEDVNDDDTLSLNLSLNHM